MSIGLLPRLYADIAVTLRQSVGDFCDLHAAAGDDPHITTNRGDAVSVVRVLGVRRVLRGGDPEAPVDGDVLFHVRRLREDLSGALEFPGHVLDWWFGSDPALAEGEVERMAEDARRVADRLGLDLDLILAERRKRQPLFVRWEACYLALWTRRSVLSREEAKQAEADRKEGARGAPRVLDAQDPFLALEPVAARHRAFVDRVLRSLHNQGVAFKEMPARAMARAARESVLPETVGTGWAPRMLGDPMWPREMPRGREGAPDAALPPTLRRQIFGGVPCRPLSVTTAEIGANVWGGVDMELGPENPRPFAELVADLNRARIPWRARMLMEGGGAAMYGFKNTAAAILGFGNNRKIFRALDENLRKKAENEDVTVKLRVSFATWAPADRPRLLASRRARLEHRIATWGTINATPVAGDPVASVMSSALAMAPASTANGNQAPLFSALVMAPWGRQGAPYADGPVLYRTPDGRMWPWEPKGAGRPRVLNLLSGPSGHGKSVNANVNLLGLCLSAAAVDGPMGAKLPLVGKVDFGRSGMGVVDLLRAALPEGRKGEALYVPYDFTPGNAFNVFGTHLGCRDPLPLEMAFLENYLALVTTALGMEPFEGMDQFLTLVVREAYRMLGTEGPNRRTKPFAPGLDPAVDAALARHGIALRPGAWWWDAVDALFDAGDLRAAELAQRHAVPLLEDLIDASRADQVDQLFRKVVPNPPENLIERFGRYIKDFIRRYPSLNTPTRIEFGPARVVVLDMDAVAPTGSAAASRQTHMVFMLAFHMIGRRFFVRPEYAELAPPRYRAFHRDGFRAVYESVKMLDMDEFHRASAEPHVLAMVERAGREGRRHGLDITLASQAGEDFGSYLLGHATAHFVCGTGGADEADRLADLMGLSPSTRAIIANSLTGPDPRGSGAPFVLVAEVNGVKYEQMLVLTVGPVELWALSTTPEDAALRGRLYESLGIGEALRRLAAAFPAGTAAAEVRRRKEARMKRDPRADGALVEAGVIDGIADELWRGVGLGAPRGEAAAG